MHRALAATAIVVAFFASSRASAFCRTRTVKVAPNYDASKLGCSLEGLPFFWRNSCIGYSIHEKASKRISYEDAANGISQAFTRWTGASCPADAQGRSRPSIDVRDLGPVACGKIEHKNNGIPNQNVIVFRDEAWPHGKDVLGLTIVSYDKNTGELFGADMELNTYDMDPLAVRDPVAENDYDFLSVATHEAGHFLGINHSDVTQTTMFASYDRGQTAQRVLAPDDIEAVCSIYRPDGERTVLNGQVSAGGQCDPTPRGGYTHDCYEPDDCTIGRGHTRGQTTLGLAAVVAVLATARRRRRVVRI